MNDDKNTILVRTTDATVRRGENPTELKVEILADNINVFLTQMESILEQAPDEVGKFQFTELSVCAEINAKGKLVLLGSGVETGIKGSLTFKFQKK